MSDHTKKQTAEQKAKKAIDKQAQEAENLATEAEKQAKNVAAAAAAKATELKEAAQEAVNDLVDSVGPKAEKLVAEAKKEAEHLKEEAESASERAKEISHNLSEKICEELRDPAVSTTMLFTGVTTAAASTYLNQQHKQGKLTTLVAVGVVVGVAALSVAEYFSVKAYFKNTKPSN